MLNPHPRTSSTTHTGSHPSTAATGRDGHAGPSVLVREEGVPLGESSRDGTSHLGTCRPRQVVATFRGIEPWPLPPWEDPGVDHARKAASSGAGVHLASASSRRAKDVATALQWLRDGAPIDDVRTVIEVRHRFELSPEFARRYAANIVRAAANVLRAERSNPSREEIIHAVA